VEGGEGCVSPPVAEPWSSWLVSPEPPAPRPGPAIAQSTTTKPGDQNPRPQQQANAVRPRGFVGRNWVPIGRERGCQGGRSAVTMARSSERAAQTEQTLRRLRGDHAPCCRPFLPGPHPACCIFAGRMAVAGGLAPGLPAGSGSSPGPWVSTRTVLGSADPGAEGAVALATADAAGLMPALTNWLVSV